MISELLDWVLVLHEAGFAVVLWVFLKLRVEKTPMPMSTASRLALSILNGCNAVFSDFQNITVTSRVRFEQAAWGEVHSASRRRMGMYKHKVDEIMQVINTLAGDAEVHDLALWRKPRPVISSC